MSLLDKLNEREDISDYANDFYREYMKVNKEAILKGMKLDHEAIFLKDLEKKVQKEIKKRFTHEELELIMTMDNDPSWNILKPSQLLKYRQLFNGAEIVQLCKAKISPGKANKYDIRFGVSLIKLVEAGISPKKADKYNPRFKSEDIVWLCNKKISPKKADKYNGRFDGADISYLVEAGISPSKADKYDKKFNALQISLLHKAGISQAMVDEYDRRYSRLRVSSNAIILLHNFGVTPQVFNSYPELKKNEILEALGKIEDFIWHYNKIDSSEWKYLGTSSHSVVLRIDKNAWKFSLDNPREYKLLKKLNNPQNVVEVRKLHDRPKVMELEYIEGPSLEQLLKEKNKLKTKKVIKYGADILNGINELRAAGIYHRDLHVKNILIDSHKHRAVIIDLDLSSENPNEINPLNRSYGGNNDLVSLGLLMYKMAVGRNLFNESDDDTTRLVRENVKKLREEAYSNPAKKQEYLNKAREDIKDKKLAGLVYTLLDNDLFTQPSMKQIKKAKNMFEQHVKNT